MKECASDDCLMDSIIVKCVDETKKKVSDADDDNNVSVYMFVRQFPVFF